MKKIGVLYPDPEHYASQQGETVHQPLLGPSIGTILQNRRTLEGAMTAAGLALKAKVVAHFKNTYGINIKLRFSRKAGCSMCPCSPGFVISSDSANYWGRLKDEQEFSVWSKGKDLDVREPKWLPFSFTPPPHLVGLA